MEEQLIALKTAELSKKIGFNPPTYLVKDFVVKSTGKQQGRMVGGYAELYDRDNHIALISQSLLQQWYRKTHQIHINVRYIDDDLNFRSIIIMMSSNTEIFESKNGGYEEVLELALFKAGEILND